MSCHSCSELCDIDERIHDIIKHCGPHEAWHPTRTEFLMFLLDLCCKLKVDPDDAPEIFS